jgi:dinuclear metal center YbgI/SA1388 family protein
MSVDHHTLEHHLDELLEAAGFHDYADNGLQVEGRSHINTIATAASASLAACRAAVIAGADALLVHHGTIWSGLTSIRGMIRQRLACLLPADCNLFAYHLPLDAHPELGNNAVALRLLQIEATGRFADHRGRAIGAIGSPSQPIAIETLVQRCQGTFDHPVVHCPGGPDTIARLGVVTGGGDSYLAEAATAHLDALVTGEASERCWHEAAELGIHLLACGHHATECIAIHELGARLATTFQLTHIPVHEDNPL